jgi:predicted nucleic acid-binding protein
VPLPNPRAVLIDTNVLVAAGDRGDAHHREALSLLEELDADLLVAPTVVAETCYLLSEHIGTPAEVEFLRNFGSGTFSLVQLRVEDLTRMAELVERYADLGLGATDASIVALAERLGIDTVATFDRRHFSVVRPDHVEAFTLLPL